MFTQSTAEKRRIVERKHAETRHPKDARASRDVEGGVSAETAPTIRELNDAFRTTMTGGRVVMTVGVDALASDVKAIVIRRVATFTEFTPDNDPHGEHDFGNFELAGHKFFWKIDY